MIWLKHLGALWYQHGEVVTEGAIHLAAGAFVLAFLWTWLRQGIRRYRIVRASREAERQLHALGVARKHAVTHRVVSERRKDAA